MFNCVYFLTQFLAAWTTVNMCMYQIMFTKVIHKQFTVAEHLHGTEHNGAAVIINNGYNYDNNDTSFISNCSNYNKVL